MTDTIIKKKIEVIMSEDVYETICKLIKQQEKNRENMRKLYQEKNNKNSELYPKGSYKKASKRIQFDSVKVL